jgi:hypothetical protein
MSASDKRRELRADDRPLRQFDGMALTVRKSNRLNPVVPIERPC